LIRFKNGKGPYNDIHKQVGDGIDWVSRTCFLCVKEDIQILSDSLVQHPGEN